MPNDDRSEMEAARLAGLAKRHEQRLENATYTAAEVKVLTEAALRLGRKEALDAAPGAVDAAIRSLSGMSGQHGVDHSYDGTCPLCKGDIPRITQAVTMALNHDALDEPECDCRYGHQPQYTKHEHTCSWGRWHLVQRALKASPDATSGRTDPNSTSAMLKSLEGK